MLRLGDILEENSRVLSSAFAHHPPHLGQIGKASRFGDGETDEIDVVIGQQALEHPAAKIREPPLQGVSRGRPAVRLVASILLFGWTVLGRDRRR
jgi:hypothetical protein